MHIRAIEKRDFLAVNKQIRETFARTEHGYGNEAELVAKIRGSQEYLPELELVAVSDSHDEILGHGLLSEVTIIDTENVAHTGLVLAPLSVALRRQREGIGSALLIELEKHAQAYAYRFISILGHPTYYARFGYVPAKNYQIEAPFKVPEEAFMIKPLTEHGLDAIHGTLYYSAAFG